jgi:hypothetical protein
MNTQNPFLKIVPFIVLFSAGLVSCQKQTDPGAGMASTASREKTAETTVGLQPAILWWANAPAIPYTDNILNDVPTNVGSGLGFTINGKGFVCGVQMTTSRGGSFDPNQLWAYDPAAGAWTQKTSMPESSSPFEAVSFAVGDNAYVVAGNVTWQYNQPSDTWTQKAPLFSAFRMAGSGFAINGKGYIGLGYNEFGEGFLTDWWEYDPVSDQWTAKKDFPGAKREAAAAFVANGKGYIACGEHWTSGGQHTWPVSVWQYDPVADAWTQKSDFPAAGRRNAVGAGGTIAGVDVGFVIGGDADGPADSDGWEYGPANDNWGQLINIPGGARTDAAGFVIGRSLFIANLSVAVLNWSK